MSKKLSDVTEEEIIAFREDIERITVSKGFTKEEKLEQIKIRTKAMLRDFSYLDLFDALKNSKLRGNIKKQYGASYEAAIEELLEEKKKILSIGEVNEVLESLKKETDQANSFVKETRDFLSGSTDDSKKKKK